MDEIELTPPSTKYKESFLEGLREFQEEGLAWVMELDSNELRRDFDSYVQGELNKKTWWTKDAPVNETILWAISDEVYVGKISIRHKLNADLQIFGGHIGYDTRPTFRGRGIASMMLKLALPIAKQLGIQKALLTCNDDNIASIKVIEKNGGILEKIKPQYEGGPIKRYYWITL